MLRDNINEKHLFQENATKKRLTEGGNGCWQNAAAETENDHFVYEVVVWDSMIIFICKTNIITKRNYER